MNTQLKREDKLQILKTSQICVFCSKSIKKGSLAIFLESKVFEHPGCSTSSYGYLGFDGLVERNRFGSPRCHLCGWYLENLEIHIVEMHSMNIEEYRGIFSIPEHESLVSYEIENVADDLLEEDRSTQDLMSKDRPNVLHGPHVESAGRLARQNFHSLARKKNNPLNKKKKRGRLR